MDGKIKKVGFLTNIPRPYRVGFLNYLNEFLKDRNIDLKVFFYSSLNEYPERKEKIDFRNLKFEYTFLDYRAFKVKGGKYFFVKNLKKSLEDENLDALIIGNMSTILYQALELDVKKILYSGSFNEYGFLRTLFRKKFLKKIDTIISYSTISKEYFKSLGFPSEKIFVATNSVDNDFFRITDFKKKEFNCLKILFCSKLSRRKGAHLLPEILKGIDCEYEFHIVGSGELGNFLKENLKGEVFFHGFLQPEELKALYHSLNLFLFPTFKDPWGLVVNEAMLGGMAVLSSVYAGVTHDLIFDNVNGYRIAPFNVGDIVDKINYLGNNLDVLREFGKNSLKMALEKSGFKIMAKAFLGAILS